MKFNICLLALCLCCSGMVQADKIIYKTGQAFPFDVIIIRETYQKVFYYIKNGERQEQSEKQSKIQQVIRDNTPQDFTVAENFFKSGDYKRAIESYARAIKYKNWTEPYSIFGIAESLRLQKKWSNASSEYSKLINDFKDNKFLPVAHFNRGVCLYEDRNYRDAVEDFKKAETLYQEIGAPEEALEATFYQGVTYEKGGKFDKAAEAYKEIEKNKRQVPVLAKKSFIRLGFCALEQDNDSEAKKRFMEFIEDRKVLDKEVLRSAYLGLGNLHFKNRKAKDALFCYLRVITMYSDTSEETFQAYQRASKVFSVLNKQQESRNLDLKRRQLFGK